MQPPLGVIGKNINIFQNYLLPNKSENPVIFFLTMKYLFESSEKYVNLRFVIQFR